MSDEVDLRSDEVAMLQAIGEARYEYARQHGMNAGKGPSRGNASGPANHVKGALTEFACSLILNLSWRPCVGRRGEPDVGGFIEVRSTARKLFIKPPDAGPFVLMAQLTLHRYRACGWFEAEHAQLIYPLDPATDDCDAGHRVPEGELRPIAELRELIITRRRKP